MYADNARTGVNRRLQAAAEMPDTALDSGSAGSGCTNGSGTLPGGSCAPMAFPYVPMQRQSARRYGQQEALREGTLFPGLNLPFHRELETRFPAVNTALSELMALDFAIAELGLYLTTHRSDEDALELFRSYIRLANEGREKYVATYGPLRQTDMTQGDTFCWLNDPWPWEIGGND